MGGGFPQVGTGIGQDRGRQIELAVAPDCIQRPPVVDFDTDGAAALRRIGKSNSDTVDVTDVDELLRKADRAQRVVDANMLEVFGVLSGLIRFY